MLRFTSKLRRCRPSPPTLPSLQHFFRHYTSSFFSSPYSSHYILSSSSHYHLHHRKGHRNYNPRWLPELRSLSPHDCVSFARRLSTQPDFPRSDEPILPVRAVISMLDSYHDATGLPWWFIISSSTVAMRLALFPLVVLQLKKLRRIGELLPTLPPPFPPPLSGQSFRNQIALFLKEKKAARCPSVFWWFSSFAVQVPCFFMWLMSVRRMSLEHHPGFDTGGMLWFHNLTEYPHGALGLVFPFFIAGLHFTNIQISFQKSSLQQAPGSFRLLLKLYKIYLQVLTLPILIAAFNVPQGSLVYWLTNSSLSLIQLLCLRHPGFLEYLGLPTKNAPVLAPPNKERGSSEVADIMILTKTGEIPAVDLSPAVLVAYSVKILTDGHKDTAIRLLRLALTKDPGNVRALLIMGQTVLQDKQYAEAAGWLENAVSKLLEAGYPTGVEEVDLLILSSMWAGIANVHQGKVEEGLLHLERIAQLEEPEHPKSKAHYYDGLLVLSSALLTVDRKADALAYLHKAVAYDPAYSVYLDDFERDPNDIASDLATSRREL
ncbi:cytochrome oxidase biogenesis protein [Striga asiatica]|uniref:Cytochrome oxidase biogenesis protein n=1 Tax=Striga asiatica TaxID=4170 RepID=A0A5A7P5Y8_STRAF|nr:cytochrome oxidase biogenesis protein [Striga asiatica]